MIGTEQDSVGSVELHQVSEVCRIQHHAVEEEPVYRLGWIVLGSGPADIVVPENPGSYRGERPTAVATNNYEIAVTHER